MSTDQVSESTDPPATPSPLARAGRLILTAARRLPVTAAFVAALEGLLDVPVESFDERFTTTLASSGPSSRAPEDARAAAHLLESWLAWTSRET